MCMVSNVGDQYHEYFKPKPWYPNPIPYFKNNPEVTQAEFEALKKEVIEMRELLKRAKAFDERTGQLDCEMDSKIEILRRVAEAVGISLDDILKKPAPLPSVAK
jgi:pyrroloquinoline quinone (PQQ) biosynthesis protein C